MWSWLVTSSNDGTSPPAEKVRSPRPVTTRTWAEASWLKSKIADWMSWAMSMVMELAACGRFTVRTVIGPVLSIRMLIGCFLAWSTCGSWGRSGHDWRLEREGRPEQPYEQENDGHVEDELECCEADDVSRS